MDKKNIFIQLRDARRANNLTTERDVLWKLLDKPAITIRCRIKALHKLTNVYSELNDWESATECYETLFGLEPDNYSNYWTAAYFWVPEDPQRALDILLDPLQRIKRVPRKYRGQLYGMASEAHSCLEQLKAAYDCYLKACHYGPFCHCLYAAYGLAEHGYRITETKQNILRAWNLHMGPDTHPGHMEGMRDSLSRLLKWY